MHTTFRAIDGPLPQNIEAEQSVLGSLLIDRNAIEEIAAFLTPDDFFLPTNAEIYRAMFRLFERRQPTDIVTVSDYLKGQGRSDETGGPAYLASLATITPTSVNVEYYARIVQRLSAHRKLVDAANQITRIGYDEHLGLDESYAQAEQIIFDLAETSAERPILHVADILPGVLEQIDDAQNGGESARRVKTGFIGIDRMTGGLKNGNFDVIAARPAMGKTALALNIAHRVAKQGIPVCIFSLEMDKEELSIRLLAMQTGIDSRRIDEGKLDETEMHRVADAAGKIAEIPLHIDDTPNMKIIELGVKARRIVRQESVRLIVVDYLQLMSANLDDELAEITRITKGLKSLARELRVPVIALSQLSREPEKRPNHRPYLADLRSSGTIEQDADIVMFLYRDVKYDPDTSEPNVAELIFAKQRNSTEGTVKLYFDDPSQRFHDLDRREQ